MNLPEFLVDHPDGEIRLTGHRIGLYDIASFHQDGYTPEMLHKQFPSLPLPLIRQVLDFYRENKEEVDVYVAECDAKIETPPRPAGLQGPDSRRAAKSHASVEAGEDEVTPFLPRFSCSTSTCGVSSPTQYGITMQILCGC